MEDSLPPGFRFHPTDEELITYYLNHKVSDFGFSPKAIADVDLNKCEPWDLPGKAKMGKKEWYYFSLRDRKYPTGLRTNRATDSGYWKTTGKDKEIFHCGAQVGMKKTLVFYRGRAPKGEKTNWVMHEYRHQTKFGYKPTKEEWVVCRVFRKSANNTKKPHPTSCQSMPQLLDSSCQTTSVGDIGEIDVSAVLNHLVTTPTSLNSAASTSTNNISGINNNDINTTINDNKMDMNMYMNWTLAGDVANQSLLSWPPPSLLGSNLPILRALQLNSYQQQDGSSLLTDGMKYNFPSSSSHGMDSAQQQPFGGTTESIWRNY